MKEPIIKFDLATMMQVQAEDGNVESQFTIGALMLHGSDAYPVTKGKVYIAQDQVAGLKWLRKAAAQNHPEAQYNIGLAYLRGLGVVQSRDKALPWFRRAADGGEVNAQGIIGEVLYWGADGIAKHPEEGIKFLRPAAKHGIARAQHCLGHAYFHGKVVPKDLRAAFLWWQKASKQGNADSQYNLAWCYWNAQGVQVDQDKAIKWMQKAVAGGEARAPKDLAEFNKTRRGPAEMAEFRKSQRASLEREAAAGCGRSAAELKEFGLRLPAAVAKLNGGQCSTEGCDATYTGKFIPDDWELIPCSYSDGRPPTYSYECPKCIAEMRARLRARQAAEAAAYEKQHEQCAGCAKPLAFKDMNNDHWLSGGNAPFEDCKMFCGSCFAAKVKAIARNRQAATARAQ